MKHPMSRALAFLAAGAALGAALAGCTKPSAASGVDAPRRTVRVATVALGAPGAAVRAVGLLSPKDQARLSFKLGGYIETIRVEEGQQVRAGELLAELKRTEVDAGLVQARQNAAKAQRDLARGRALFADGVATLEQFQDLTTAAEVAAAALRAAEFNAWHAGIRAPADGVVLQKLADANELVQAGQPVLSVGKTGRGWVVRVGLSDRDAVRMHCGDPATLTFDAWPGRIFEGHVGNIAAAADPATGTFTVEVAVEPGNARFVQGLVAKVALRPSGAGPVLVVPLQALVEANGDEAGVFVLDADGAAGHPGTVRRVTIRIGRMSGNEVEVREGVSAGMRIVIDGAAFLENGERVRVEAES